MDEKHLNILIAEDDSLHQKVILHVLKKLGISADIANNGIEAIQALERKPYSIILMDIQMPQMSGIEAARTIRDRYSHGPKIIMVTGCPIDEYKKSCLDAGANTFLSKPLRAKDLILAIELCLPSISNEVQSA